MKKTQLFLVVILFVMAGQFATAQQQPPYFNVPMTWGQSTGNYTCVTRPTGDARIAIITCDPGRFSQYPPFAQEFLIAHEHGHVYQIVYNPSILYGPNAEYDADCYAAVILALNDVNALTQTVHWFETVLGAQGGDPTHGNGFQMAQRARQCASTAGVQIARSASEPRFMEVAASTSHSVCENNEARGGARFITAVAREEDPENEEKSSLANIVSHGPHDIEDEGRGTPSVCTALEMATDSSHSAFWEISTHTGAIRKDVSQSLGASCTTKGNRSQLICQMNGTKDTSVAQLRDRIRLCLGSKEWRKECADAQCRTEKFTHPNDTDEHSTVIISDENGSTLLTITRPESSPHSHDMPGWKPGQPANWSKPVLPKP